MTTMILYEDFIMTFQLGISPFICLIFSQLLNYLIISVVMYLFSVLVFIVNHNCIYNSCDIS